MANGLKEFKTWRELSIWIQERVGDIEDKVKEIQANPDKIGKWLVRLAIMATVVLQAIILYKTSKGV